MDSSVRDAVFLSPILLESILEFAAGGTTLTLAHRDTTCAFDGAKVSCVEGRWLLLAEHQSPRHFVQPPMRYSRVAVYVWPLLPWTPPQVETMLYSCALKRISQCHAHLPMMGARVSVPLLRACI